MGPEVAEAGSEAAHLPPEVRGQPVAVVHQFIVHQFIDSYRRRSA